MATLTAAASMRYSSARASWAGTVLTTLEGLQGFVRRVPLESVSYKRRGIDGAQSRFSLGKAFSLESLVRPDRHLVCPGREAGLVCVTSIAFARLGPRPFVTHVTERRAAAKRVDCSRRGVSSEVHGICKLCSSTLGPEGP